MNASVDETWMQHALDLAKKASTLGEVPVGAVVVKQDQIIGVGYNQPIANNDPTAHAEIIALREAAKRIGNYRLVDCILYVTLEPCAMCCGAIQHARISTLVYGAKDTKTGCCGSVVNLMTETKLNHHTEVRSGILAQACGAQLSEFFKRRRQQSIFKD